MSDNEMELVDKLFEKANDYFTFVQISSKYPELLKIQQNNISYQIFELYKEIFSFKFIAKHNYYKEICIQYVKQGLIPRYEETKDEQLLHIGVEKLKEIENEYYDCDMTRRVNVLLAQIFLYMEKYQEAEKYINEAYQDYDFSTNTFILYMKILDAQKKYEDMIDYSEEYCYKYSKLHKKVCYSDLCVANIENSQYKDKFKRIFGGQDEDEC